MSIASKIEDLVKNPEKFNEESIALLMMETAQFLAGLKERLRSNDESESKAALEDAEKMRAQLQKQMNQMCESMGIKPDQVGEYLTASNESAPRTEIFNEAFGRLQTVKKKKPKRVKEWLVS